MSLPLLALSTGAPKRKLPWKVFKPSRRRIDLPGLDPIDDMNAEDATLFRAAMANLSDCAGEIVIEREIDQYTRDSEVASHCDLTVQWDFNDATQERASFWKKNFGTVLDLHYGRKPSVERILREDGTYGLPYAEIRASLYTPQQWYDLFHKMGWEAELEQEDEVERATIRVP